MKKQRLTIGERLTKLEKKVTASNLQSMKMQVQVEEHLLKLDRAIDRLRKAIPHVNFDD